MIAAGPSSPQIKPLIPGQSESAPPPGAGMTRPVWVVFSGETDIQWLRRFLKPGFRHCFVLLRDGGRWISFDPLANYTEITCYGHLPESFDLPQWLESRGLTVLSASMERCASRCAPLMPFTCVEAVKRLLGLHRRLILTPWQLYRFLSKGENNGIASFKT